MESMPPQGGMRTTRSKVMVDDSFPGSRAMGHFAGRAKKAVILFHVAFPRQS